LRAGARVATRVRVLERRCYCGLLFAIAAIVAVAVPSYLHLTGSSLRDLAAWQIRDYARAANQWRDDFPDAACPSSLERLAEYTADKQVRDVYGAPFQLLCTEHGFVVYALGEDGRLGTPDDLWTSTPN